MTSRHWTFLQSQNILHIFFHESEQEPTSTDNVSDIIFFPKICFWLLDNGFRVMIAACDTFRAGAVEQLRTHVRHLNALHPPAGGSGPPSVLLYEKGYGKDAASIAMDAINFGELGS